MKRVVYVVLGVSILIFLWNSILFAQGQQLPDEKTVYQVMQEITPLVDKEIKKEVDPILKKVKKDISQEAVKIVDNSSKIIELLDKKQKDDALSLIETSIGKLEILLKEYPEISFLPVSIEARVIETIVSLDIIKKDKELVKSLIDKGYLQDARRLLEGMVSEINIQEKNLPLITYPDALSMAAVLTKKGEFDKAKNVIQEALNALIIKENIIPLPLVRAQVILKKVLDMLKEKEIQKEKILKYIGVADYEITVAEELGYGKRGEEFKDIHNRIKEIKQKINENQESKGLLNELMEKISNFKEKIFNKKEEK